MSKQSPTKRAPGPSPQSKPTVEQAAYTDEAFLKAHSDDIYEDEDNSIQFSKIPLVVFGIFWVMLFWAGLYFDWHNDDFSTYAYKPVAGEVEAGPFDWKIEGPKLYKVNCASCHQANGMGLPGAFPPLAGSQWVSGDEDRIIKIVLNGLKGPIEVKGETYNSAMIPFGNVLNDEEVQAVVSYVRTHFGNTAEEVTVEAVTAVRAEVGSRNSQWTAEELLQAHPLN